MTKTTSNILTKYEKTTLIGVRIEQLAFGSPSLLSPEQLKSCITMEEIAELELNQKLLPFKIRRTLPNNTEEEWSLKEMIVL